MCVIEIGRGVLLRGIGIDIDGILGEIVWDRMEVYFYGIAGEDVPLWG